MLLKKHTQRVSYLLCQPCAASLGAAWAWDEATVGSMEACEHCGKRGPGHIMDCLVYAHHEAGLALALPPYERTWDLQPCEVHQLHPSRMGEEWRYLYVDPVEGHPTWRTDIRGLQGKRVLFTCLGEPVAVIYVALVQDSEERDGVEGNRWSIEWPDDNETKAGDIWLRPLENRPWPGSLERMRPGISELELAFVANWMHENELRPGLNDGRGVLRDLMGSAMGKGPGAWFVTDREARMVAMVVQWMGTNCGREWLERTLALAGLRIDKLQDPEYKGVSSRFVDAYTSASALWSKPLSGRNLMRRFVVQQNGRWVGDVSTSERKIKALFDQEENAMIFCGAEHIRLFEVLASECHSDTFEFYVLSNT